MAENLYLLKLGKSAAEAMTKRLDLDVAPSHVRLSTFAPLSNYGFPQGAEGAMIGLKTEGVVVGSENKPEAPRLFVPWQNVSYIGDGAGLENKK